MYIAPAGLAEEAGTPIQRTGASYHLKMMALSSGDGYIRNEYTVILIKNSAPF